MSERYFLPAGSGAKHSPGPGVNLRAIAGNGLMISVVDLDEGGIVPDHEHSHEQMGYLLSGRLEFTIDGITRTLGPGDAWRIPGGVRHSARAVDGPAVALDVFHPVRDDYR